MENCKNGLCDTKNQTNELFIPKDHNDSGISFFVIKSGDEMEKIKIEGISYAETLVRGEDSISFKFIPHNVEITLPNGEVAICKDGMFDMNDGENN